MTVPEKVLIDGSVSRGFEPVRDAFIDNFMRRGELGGGCCIYQHGEKVVDLWGGVRDRASGEPWAKDTMAIVHSTTKGMAAMVMGSRIHVAGSITASASRLTGPSSHRTARSGLRSASSLPIKQGCSHSTSRSTATLLRTWTASPA